MSPWQEFLDSFMLFRDPLLAGGVAGLALGLLGIFIVLRRMVFFSAALAQSAGLGVALAFYVEIMFHISVSPVWGAALCATATGFVLFMPHERMGTTREAMLGLVFIAAGALAVIMGSAIAQEAQDIHAILFGTAVLVRQTDLLVLLFGATATVLAVVMLWRGLVFVNFDPEGARVQGLPVRWLNVALIGFIVLMNSVAMRTNGMLPVFAFSVLPAVAALGLTRRLWLAAVLGALFGAIAGVGGYILAFFRDLPVGASQAFVAVVLATVGLLVSRFR